MARLPQPGGDSGNWGEILNDYLSQSLTSTGELQDNVVDSDQVKNGAITGSKLAPGAVTKSDIGLPNVDNTSDANKPISAATQAALDGKVVGVASATDNAIARFDGTSGKLIQDSAVVVTDNGTLQLGGANNLHAAGTLLNLAGTTGTEVSLLTSSTANNRSGISFIKSNGTTNAPTVSANNDLVGFLGFKGYDGSATVLTGLVQGAVDGAVSANTIPMRIDFITGTTSANRAVRLSVKSDGNVGFGTQSPTHTLTLPSTGTGVALYNTADQTTNYERVRHFWQSNSFYMITEYGGTSTHRQLVVGSGGALGYFDNTASNGYKVQITSGSTSVTDPIRFTSTMSGSTAQNGFAVRVTSTQTGAGGYTALLVASTETSVGTGTKLLADLQVGGVSRLSIDNTGSLAASGYLSAYNGVANQVTLGRTAAGTVGPGITFGNALDTNIYRAAATIVGTPATLKTDNVFQANPLITSLSNTVKAFSNTPLFTLASDDSNGWYGLGLSNEPTYTSTVNKAAVGSFLGGIYNNPIVNSSGSPATIIGLDQNVTIANSSVAVPSYQAIRVRKPTITSGAITNAYALYLYPQKVTGVTNAYGIFFDTPSTDGVGSDINWNGDTRLYRSTSNSLRTDSNFVVNAKHSINASGTHFMANVSSEPATPVGGGSIYVENGALKYKGSSGTVTTLGPA